MVTKKGGWRVDEMVRTDGGKQPMIGWMDGPWEGASTYLFKSHGGLEFEAGGAGGLKA